MPKRPYPVRAALDKLSIAELQAMCRDVVGIDARSTRRNYLINRIRSALAARAMSWVKPMPATDNRPVSELTTRELRLRYQEVIGRPTKSYGRKYLRDKINDALRGRIPVGPRTLRSPHASAPEYMFFTIRLPRDLVDRLDDVWSRLGFCSRSDFLRKALHDYLRHAGEHEAAAVFEPWLQMYDDATPVG